MNLLSMVAMALSGEGLYLNPALDGVTVNFSSITFDAIDYSGVRIATDGDVDERTSVLGPYADRYDWLLVGGTAADYEVRFEYQPGSSANRGGITDANYYQLSTNRETHVYADFIGQPAEATVLVTIRHRVNTTEAVSFTVTLSANVFSIGDG